MLLCVFVITLVIVSAGAETDPDLEEVTSRPIPCQLTKHCLTELGIHSDCVKRICVCVNNSKEYLTGDTATCFKPQADIGGKCESRAECQMKSAECKAHTCECLKGFVASKDKSSCLEGGKLLGEPCEIEEQCESKYSGDVSCSGTPASLSNKTCSCTQGHTKNGNRCYKRKSIGESCENSFNCQHIQQSTCDQVCSCAKGFVTNARNDVCLPVATDYGSQCEENVQCSEDMGDDLLCNDNHCECKPELDFDYEENKCIQIKDDATTQVEKEQQTEAATDMAPSQDPNMARSNKKLNVSGIATVGTRISSILITTAVLLIKII